MATTTRGGRWTRWLLLFLCVEKIVQHAFVTWALATDRFELRDSVVVAHEPLAVIGGLVGLLDIVALWGVAVDPSWVPRLLTLLALVDIVGEFVAQGTLAIDVTVSFLVAIAVLVTTRLRYRRPALDG